MEEDEEHVLEGEVNKWAESSVKALNKVEIRDDTKATPLCAPTLVEQTKLADAIIEETVEKALKYTQVDEKVNAQKKELISSYCDTITVSYYTDTIIVSCSSCFHFFYIYIYCFKIQECWGRIL